MNSGLIRLSRSIAENNGTAQNIEFGEKSKSNCRGPLVNALYLIRSLIDWCSGTFASQAGSVLFSRTCMQFYVSNLNSFVKRSFFCCLSGTNNSTKHKKKHSEVHSSKINYGNHEIIVWAYYEKKGVIISGEKEIVMRNQVRNKTRFACFVAFVDFHKCVKWSVTSEFRLCSAVCTQI